MIVSANHRHCPNTVPNFGFFSNNYSMFGHTFTCYLHKTYRLKKKSISDHNTLSKSNWICFSRNVHTFSCNLFFFWNDVAKNSISLFTTTQLFILQKIFLPGKYAAKTEKNDPPLLAFGDWVHVTRCVKILTGNFSFRFNIYVCTRARYKRFLCVLLLIISYGEVYAQFTWRHHTAHMATLQHGKHLSIVFVCIRSHVSSGIAESNKSDLRERKRVEASLESYERGQFSVLRNHFCDLEWPT